MTHIRTRRGQIDNNDLAHVYRLGVQPVFAEPAPFGGRGKINPHVTRFHNDDGSVTDVFHVKPIYYETKDHQWRPMSEVASHHGNRKIVLTPDWASRMSLRYFQWLTKRQQLFPGKQLSIDTSLGFILQPEQYEYATVSTFYPDPNPETTTVDGYAGYDGAANWTSLRGQSTGNNTNDTDSNFTWQGERVSANFYSMTRCAFLFDTSGVTDTDTVSSATFSVYRTSAGGSQAEATYPPNLRLVSSSLASNTAIVNADFASANWGTTAFCDSDVAHSTFNTNTSQYHSFTLNASGRAAITFTGITKLGLRPSNDFSDSTAPGARSYAYGSTAEVASTTEDPKLVVTHAAGATIPKVKTFNTIANASIKTLDTIAKASLKTVNTIGS